MKELIEALMILDKYFEGKYPIHCSRDFLTLCVSPEKVSEEDIVKLEELGFITDEDEDCLSHLDT